jgi:phosphatidylinositol alpha-mannosyltransferase
VRIAVVSPYAFDAFGGVQEQVALLVRHLRAAGHTAWAVAPGSEGPEGTRHVGGITRVRANKSLAPLTLDPRTVRRVRAAVEDADVVHVHEPFMPLASLAVTLGGTPPAVGTFHADPGPVVRSLYRGGAFLLRRLARRLAAVTAVSEVAAAAIAPFTECVIVPNGLETGAYAPGGAKAAGRVAFVGRDDKRKGLDVLLEAWPRVAAHVPGAVLRVVGAERTTGPAGVEFLGRVDEEAKRRELAEAAVFAAPNLGGESFGIIVVEGLAAGCAVVASDLPAFRAVAGKAARFVQPGHPLELGDALSAALHEAGPAGDEAVIARSRAAAARFDGSAVAARYTALYEKAAGG